MTVTVVGFGDLMVSKTKIVFALMPFIFQCRNQAKNR